MCNDQPKSVPLFAARNRSRRNLSYNTVHAAKCLTPFHMKVILVNMCDLFSINS